MNRREKAETERRLITIINENTNDLDAFEEMKSLPVSRQDDFDRGALRVKELSKIDFFTLFKLPLGKDFSYLDFGGGDGEIAAAIANVMNLAKSQVFVSDIKDWFGNIQQNRYTEQVTYRYLKRTRLPFKRESMSFVSAFQVLHHLQNYKKSISEIHRVLKKGGIFLIREHDCRSVEDSVIIDLEHSVREMVLNDQSPMYLHRYFAKYLSKEELSATLQEMGFKRVELEYADPRGPTRQYYTVWEKI
jgi:ubiquinone/menaquinone biosynthesis C-methylase UbiE